MTRVIVFADRFGSELQPLTDQCPVALLPIAAKPVLVHCLEDVAMAGLHALTLVVSHHADLIKSTLGSGSRWGLTIEYALSRGEERPAGVLQHLEARAADSILLLRGDILRSPCLTAFLQKLMQQPLNARELVLGGKRAQVLYVPSGAAMDDLSAVAWPPAAEAQVGRMVSTDTLEGSVHALRDLANYHQANLDAAARRIPGLLLPGRQSAIGLLIGRQSRVSPRSVRHGVALVGSSCRVDASAVFEGEVVVSDNVLIDREAEIQNSVILPNTYVGQLVHVRNAIVRGSDLIRVDTGAHLHVNDTFLIADLGANGTLEHLSRPLNRLVGAFSLVLSLPLWPVALFLAFRRNPRQPLIRKRLRGNRIELNEFGIRQRGNFSAWEWACDAPVLRYLPRLIAVMRGDLKLVGTLPISEQEAAERVDDWQREADRAPSGLIGPSQLLLPAEATEEDVILSDALYARQRSLAKDISLLGVALRHLFRREAWTRR